MKKSVILDIFHGVRGQCEKMQLPKEFFEKSKASDAFDILAKKLTPELLQLHNQYVDALVADNCNEIDFYFSEGFKLGLLIGLECVEN